MTSWMIVLLGASALGRPPEPAEIIGGVPTEPDEFTSVVALLHDTGGLCTGTLVAPGVVLTAAHCLDGRSTHSLSVGAGPRVLPGDGVPVSSYGIHPEYCRECDPTDDDIFDYGYVLIPTDALDTGSFVELLADQDDWDAAIGRDEEITVVGYGRDESGRMHTKRRVQTSIRSQTATGQEFYAGGDFRDSCRGDSGGPAFVQLEDGRWVQAGIVSRGSDPCGRGGVYATPYPALQWLQEQTGATFCGDDCGDCTCLDTTPEPRADGCGCRSDAEPRPAWLLLGLLALGMRRCRARLVGRT